MGRFKDDAGDTLVEILVALAVLSIGIVALVGALTTHVSTTVLNRQQAQSESVLTSAGEYVKGLSASALPFSCTSTTSTTVTTAQLPRDPAYTVTYGPAEPVDGQPCSSLLAVPVSVTGNGYSLQVKVVRRP